MSAQGTLAIAEIDRAFEGLDVKQALLSRTFERVGDDLVEVIETWDGMHPACPFAVVDLETQALRTDVRVVGRRVRMSCEEYRARYVIPN